jgi:hypothetical protein
MWWVPLALAAGAVGFSLVTLAFGQVHVAYAPLLALAVFLTWVRTPLASWGTGLAAAALVGVPLTALAWPGRPEWFTAVGPCAAAAIGAGAAVRSYRWLTFLALLVALAGSAGACFLGPRPAVTLHAGVLSGLFVAVCTGIVARASGIRQLLPIILGVLGGTPVGLLVGGSAGFVGTLGLMVATRVPWEWTWLPCAVGAAVGAVIGALRVGRRAARQFELNLVGAAVPEKRPSP